MLKVSASHRIVLYYDVLRYSAIQGTHCAVLSHCALFSVPSCARLCALMCADFLFGL